MPRNDSPVVEDCHARMAWDDVLLARSVDQGIIAPVILNLGITDELTNNYSDSMDMDKPEFRV
ncbi:MAG: hypothetical protein HC889_14390 [Synechococcaceae cyanobacterium SM1_2_3]|nr:hypothetical protein [Synechococcaceae cyanobacterium SM1_2_3]